MLLLLLLSTSLIFSTYKFFTSLVPVQSAIHQEPKTRGDEQLDFFSNPTDSTVRHHPSTPLVLRYHRRTMCKLLTNYRICAYVRVKWYRPDNNGRVRKEYFPCHREKRDETRPDPAIKNCKSVRYPLLFKTPCPNGGKPDPNKPEDNVKGYPLRFPLWYCEDCKWFR